MKRLSNETELHINLVAWLRQVGEPLYPALRFVKHTPNEALSSGDDTRAVQQANGTWRNVPISVLRGGLMGVRPGVFDFEFLYPNTTLIAAPPFMPSSNPRSITNLGQYRGLAFELKRAGGRIDPDQVTWAAHYAANDWFTAVFYGDWAPAAWLLIRWVGGDPARIQGLE
ncbi:MAG: hypothetical protein IPP13_21715 [Kouleothrix sp.]|jgi:hypothetical protein|nr:hypothetical protein [Kouleothrix sp.]